METMEKGIIKLIANEKKSFNVSQIHLKLKLL